MVVAQSDKTFHLLRLLIKKLNTSYQNLDLIRIFKRNKVAKFLRIILAVFDTANWKT